MRILHPGRILPLVLVVLRRVLLELPRELLRRVLRVLGVQWHVLRLHAEQRVRYRRLLLDLLLRLLNMNMVFNGHQKKTNSVNVNVTLCFLSSAYPF